MLRIGLTGGIGSGKSTTAALFANRGVPVVDTDAIARQLAEPGQAGYGEIVRAFGDTILDNQGRIDRRRLRERVFGDPAERRCLEAILHPLIRAEVRERVAGLNAPYCIIVVPLLIEAAFTDMVDRVLVVDADEQQQINRVARRDGVSAEQVRKIMAAQTSRRERLEQADDVLNNGGDLEQLDHEVGRVHAYYLSLAESV